MGIITFLSYPFFVLMRYSFGHGIRFLFKKFRCKVEPDKPPSSRYKHHELKSNEKGLSENLILYCGDLDSRDRLINTIKRCGVC